VTATSTLTLTTPAPFRLEHTVALLQRLPNNPVDVLAGGAYVRAFETEAGLVTWRVTQGPPAARGGRRAATVCAELAGPAGDPAPWRARLRRMLNLDADLAPFFRVARGIPEVAALTAYAKGVRPPRFASLHEAFAMVIPFQQVSLASGIATVRRLVAALSRPVEAHGAVLHPFPPAAALAAAPDATLRAAGLSAVKAASLRAIAALVADGALREDDLARLETPALVERLRALPAVGPWTASLLALRCFGRLDVFPPGDVAAVKALGPVGGDAVLERLGPWRGMLYYLFSLRRIALARAANGC
jgi:3-methyladenine DNA glycosylase/8-oxoguanine DNA glycosylase